MRASMTNKELQAKLAEYPDDIFVYLEDNEIIFPVGAVENGHEYRMGSWWYRSGKPDDDKRETRQAICLLYARDDGRV